MNTVLRIKGQDVDCTLVKETKYTKQYKLAIDKHFEPLAEIIEGQGEKKIVVDMTDTVMFIQHNDFTIETQEYQRLGDQILIKADWPTI